jgi:sec-independent protein translocase protein TatA
MELLPVIGFWSPGPWELAVIAVLALLIFGRRLPEIMRGLGGSMREFRKGLDDGLSQDQIRHDKDLHPKQVEGTAARGEDEEDEGDEDDKGGERKS